MSLSAQPPARSFARPDSAQQDQMLENVRQFAAAHLERAENLSCVDAPSAGNAKAITVEFTSALPQQKASSLDPSSLVRDVFAVSSGTEIYWDHAATLRGQSVAVYNYSFAINGKTRGGSIFADANTGVIARMIFRGVDAPAHLFCAARP